MNSLLRLTCCAPKLEVISEDKGTAFVWTPKSLRAFRLHTCSEKFVKDFCSWGKHMTLLKGNKGLVTDAVTQCPSYCNSLKI